jgi:hypothetical protein
MGPAARVHCSLPDWARFVADQLKGARGAKKAFLKAKTYQVLFSAPFADKSYGVGGWIMVEKNARTGGLVLTHDGSNTKNHCTAWLAPERDLAVLVATNQGGDAGAKACHEASQLLRKKYLKD